MDIIVKHYGVIDLTDEMVISDPCYDNDSYGHRFKPAKDAQGEHLFDIYVGFKKEDLTPAYLSINLPEEGFSDVAMRYNGCCYVDSGTMGIYPAKVFDEIRKDPEKQEEWYQKNICNGKYVPFFVEDGKSFITPSGYGDGAYPVSLDFDPDGRFYRLVINFIEPNEQDEYESVDFLEADDNINDFSEEAEEEGMENFVQDLISHIMFEEVLAHINTLPQTLESLYTIVYDEFMNQVKLMENQFSCKQFFTPVDDVEWYDDFRDDLCETIGYAVIQKFLPDLYKEVQEVYPECSLKEFYILKDLWDSHTDINKLIEKYL